MAPGLRSNKTKDISVIGTEVKKEDKTRKVQACGTFSVERLTDQERQGENCARSNNNNNNNYNNIFISYMLHVFVNSTL